MSNRKCIEIRESKIFNDNTVIFKLSYSKNLEKYFWSNKLYIKYEKNIENVDLSILQIPAVSGIVTVAWALGADVYVEDLDKTYLQSLSKIRSVLERFHLDFPFTTKIDVGNVVSNKFHNEGYGLLFTSGLDSITSYIKHMRKKPVLISVWGTDVRHDDERTWKKVRKISANFADKEGTKLQIIRTNIPRILNRQALYIKFGLQWWPQINHSIVLTGLCAPLTCVANIGTLFIAFGGVPEHLCHGGSHPLVARNISWGDTKVVPDNHEISRQMKIRSPLKGYLRNHRYFLLKVCNNTQRPESNCGKCEKCLRTISGLALEGIDPNKSGFKSVNGKTFDKIKESFVKKKLFKRKWIAENEGDSWARTAKAYFWKDIQKHIPETLENVLGSSQKFFEWFRDFEIQMYLQQTRKKVSPSLPYLLYMIALTICFYMPRNAQKAFNQLLDIWIDFFMK